MTEKQQKHLTETIFTMHAEGFDIPLDEEQTLIDILEGKSTYQDVLAGYVEEALKHARI